jgi:hypothetical protein
MKPNNPFNRQLQVWATLFGSRATLETNLAYMGQYKYLQDFFNLTFERKWGFSTPFCKKKHYKRNMYCIITQKIKLDNLKNVRGPY